MWIKFTSYCNKEVQDVICPGFIGDMKGIFCKWNGIKSHTKNEQKRNSKQLFENQVIFPLQNKSALQFKLQQMTQHCCCPASLSRVLCAKSIEEVEHIERQFTKKEGQLPLTPFPGHKGREGQLAPKLTLLRRATRTPCPYVGLRVLLYHTIIYMLYL